jgi:hypothetical protein
VIPKELMAAYRAAMEEFETNLRAEPEPEGLDYDQRQAWHGERNRRRRSFRRHLDKRFRQIAGYGIAGKSKDGFDTQLCAVYWAQFIVDHGGRYPKSKEDEE